MGQPQDAIAPNMGQGTGETEPMGRKQDKAGTAMPPNETERAERRQTVANALPVSACKVWSPVPR